MSPFSEFALQSAKNDEIEPGVSEIRAEEAKRNPTRNKGTSSEELRASFHAEIMAKIKRIKEEERITGLSPIIEQRADEETIEWAKRRQLAIEMIG